MIVRHYKRQTVLIATRSCHDDVANINILLLNAIAGGGDETGKYTVEKEQLEVVPMNCFLMYLSHISI